MGGTTVLRTAGGIHVLNVQLDMVLQGVWQGSVCVEVYREANAMPMNNNNMEP
jgi:hypothetical protein